MSVRCANSLLRNLQLERPNDRKWEKRNLRINSFLVHINNTIKHICFFLQ